MFTGEKVKLRAWSRMDLAACYEFFNDHEVKALLNVGIPFPGRYEETVKWIENLNSFSKDEYHMAVERLEEKDLIGGVGINEIDWKNSWCEVGIWIAKPYWGMGYGTDAMKSLISFIFNEMNLNKVKLNVFSFNERAVRSYEKAGFKKEAVLRNDIFRNGRYYDKYVMGILKEEYFAEKN